MSSPPSYVEVAVPVPLRRRFTYRLPEDLLDVPLGARVAVPFSGQKLPGIIVGRVDAPPEGVKRIASVAGRLERAPIFDAELLRFLLEAADYYLHPVGEVLRAAAPALPREALRGLRREGFLDAGQTMKGAAVATRTETVIRATRVDPIGPALGSAQRLVLALLGEREELTLDELRAHVRTPREVVRRLAERGLVTTEQRAAPSDPFFAEAVLASTPPVLHPAQDAAVQRLVKALDEGASTQLLHGVTGSGKTEVYLRVIAEARARGRGALLLVPEIALTPQLVQRVRARFGDAVAVLHSGLTDAQRHAAWWGLRHGELRLAIGARSALFAPVPDLGVIVVDEEHDGSFKQEEGFRYQARDLAILRAHRAGALVILGSATPSLESYQRAREAGTLIELNERATANALPDIEIVDLKRHRAGPSGHPLITGPLHRAIERCLAAGDQAILFLNRRGFTPSLRCGACGEGLECPACSVSLTEHRRAGLLRCHYCDYAIPLRDDCPKCGARALVPLGLGTEKLEDHLAATFAPARVARLDRDTAAGGRAIESVLDRLRRREIDLLVGTQMVTKGHDLPGVTLVGVVLADQSLAFPDFRASERTFQLLSQVAGRAGRGDRPGHVVMQTFQPGHPAVIFAQQHDYRAFAASELAHRADLGYAPFGRLVAVRVDAADEKKASEVARALADLARSHAAVRTHVVEVLGPAPAPIARVRGRFRYRLMLRGADRRALRQVAALLADRIDEGLSPARAHVDVDPVSML